jgi:Arylsulfotransferase (ASST)
MEMKIESRTARPLLGAALLALLLLSGCGGQGGDAAERPGPVAFRGLFPPFDPGKGRYVSRCGRGAAPIEVTAPAGTRVAAGSRRSRSGSFAIRTATPPGRDFPIRIGSHGSSRTYRVRCLPPDFPAWRFESHRPAPPGFFVVAFRPSADARPWVIVFDDEGAPRWWFNPPTRVLWGQVLGNGNLVWARSFGDGYGLDPRMAHEVRSPAGRLLRLVQTQGSIIDGHEYRELGDGNVLVDTYVPEDADLRRVGGPRRAGIVSAEVQELDRQGRELWHWSSRGHISLGETGRWWRNVLSNPRRRQGRETFDPVHVNSIDPRGRREVVISTRHVDAVYGISRASGEIRWKLGGSETGKSLRIVGDPAQRPLGGQHDARIGRDGRLSVYDNGKDRPRRPRVVFYRLDPGNGTARYLGQLNDPQVSRSHCCGSARELPGGGWLVSWGDNPLVSAFDGRDRLAFRLHLAASTFRAVPAPPGATSVRALDEGMEAMERQERR